MQPVFIIGSPRSGTTVLGNILNCHQLATEWYEPYYFWESFFPVHENDVWSSQYLTEKNKAAIRNEFLLFSKKSGTQIVVDKLPIHAFNVRILNEVFPEAKWVHILRDGRDVTLSIKKEWDKRRQIVQGKDFRQLFKTTITMLQRQPYWRYRVMAIKYELLANASLNPLKYLNKARWNGKIGWGPRFSDWEDYLAQHTTLEFNAMQWKKSIQAVYESWPILPSNNKIEIRYEDLLTKTEATISSVLNVLGVSPSRDFFEDIPVLKKNNFGKWSTEFTKQEVSTISPILDSILSDLQYLQNK